MIDSESIDNGSNPLFPIMFDEKYILEEPILIQETDVLSVDYVLNSYGKLLCLENMWIHSRFDPPN